MLGTEKGLYYFQPTLANWMRYIFLACMLILHRWIYKDETCRVVRVVVRRNSAWLVRCSCVQVYEEGLVLDRTWIDFALKVPQASSAAEFVWYNGVQATSTTSTSTPQFDLHTRGDRRPLRWRRRTCRGRCTRASCSCRCTSAPRASRSSLRLLLQHRRQSHCPKLHSEDYGLGWVRLAVDMIQQLLRTNEAIHLSKQMMPLRVQSSL